MRLLNLILFAVALTSGSVHAGDLYIQSTNTHSNLACERDYGNAHQINDCAVEGFQKADKELNQRYKEKIAGIKDTKNIDRFRVAQRAWVSFRDSVCQYEAGPAEEGGSSWGYRYYGCMQFVTLRWIEDMKIYLQCTTDDCPN